jgi:hypothetical protein
MHADALALRDGDGERLASSVPVIAGWLLPGLAVEPSRLVSSRGCWKAVEGNAHLFGAAGMSVRRFFAAAIADAD